ncbi:MAG: hypothetical protein RL329_825 [Bacteroidota bacterium]|jgi:PAS domain S-box-containing protein
MFSKIQAKLLYYLRYPAMTNEKGRDLIEFRSGILIGSMIMVVIPFLNLILDGAILDHELIRNILLIIHLSIFILSYKTQKMRKYLNEISYIFTISYVLMMEYVLFTKDFPIQSTTSAVAAIFCMGGAFKQRQYLGIYYLISNFFLIFWVCLCPYPEVGKMYVCSMSMIVAFLGVYVFGSKIAAVQEVSQNQAWFRNLFHHTPVSIALVGSDIKVFKINHHFQTILGYSESEIVAHGLDPIIHADDRITNDILYNALFETPNGTYKTEMRLQNKEGNTLWMRVSISATNFETSNIPESSRFAIAVFDDITEKKQAELLLNQRSTLLLQQNQALEEFSYVISHDLQEPLRMITSFSQIIQRRYLAKMNNPDIDRDFNFVIDGAKRMSKLIKDMLEYSRWSSQRFPTEKVDTQAVIVEVLQNLTYSIGQAQAEIIVGDLPTLTANRLVISQVFQNLIGNSIHYRHPNRAPRIRVDFNYRPKEKDWLCSVRDNGKGFDDTQKERIFGIFQRLETDKKGTGMGLAICKRIIEKQGGTIWAEGVPNEGATFQFTV